MSDKDTGGPAFPSDFGNIPESVGEYGRANGVTIREYFAAKAMAALMTGFLSDGGDYPNREGIALHAYAYADAMLEARKS